MNKREKADAINKKDIMEAVNKAVTSAIKNEIKKFPAGYLTEITEVVVRDREITATEEMLYIMGYFEFGESIEILAEEHKRHERLIEAKLRKAMEDGSALIDYHLRKGILRGKVDETRLMKAEQELRCALRDDSKMTVK